MDAALRNTISLGKTCDETSKILGIKRSSVAGRAKRLKLSFKGREIKESQVKIKKLHLKAIKMRFGNDSPTIDGVTREPPKLINAHLYTGKGMSLMEAGIENCRFPRDDMGKDGFPRCCGEKVIEKTSWCPEHFNIIREKR